jgi:uncharacterized membrane protein YjgN (DUF898 family)
MNFSFQLTGKKWFGLYLTLIVFYFIPVIAMQFMSAHMKTDPNDYNAAIISLVLFLVMVVTILLVTVPIMKLFLQNTHFNDKPFSFTGTTSTFAWLNIKGILLSIITIGIYYPWFITNLMTFFTGKTAYHETPFSFNGKAITLLKIMLLLLALPIIGYVLVFVTFFKEQANDPIFAIINQAVVMMIMMPYTVYMYNWLINISFKSYTIQWDTPIMQTIGVFFKEFFLTIITAGIYFPVALAKIAALLTHQTFISNNTGRVFQCNATYNYGLIWKTVWVEVLLTIITCGIYGAWAYCNIARAYINPISVVKV